MRGNICLAVATDSKRGIEISFNANRLIKCREGVSVNLDDLLMDVNQTMARR